MADELFRLSNNLVDVLGITVEYQRYLTDEEIMSEYETDLFIEDKKGRRLNENVFAEAFTAVNALQYNNGMFYTRTGKASEPMIARDIWESIKDFGITSDVGKWTDKLLKAVKLASTVENLSVSPNMIPFANGNLYIDKWLFRENEFTPVPYRLPVRLADNLPDMPHFRKWLHDLFYEDDITTIQEYLGYCLIPTTRAQKALFLVGEGGAGKSLIGSILENILGDAMISTQSTRDFLADKFKLPELEHKLVLYDDDLDNTALGETGFYKKLITNKIAITADRKYSQAFKFTPHVKIVSCCNQMLTSMYDNSSGFFRRLLPIQVKPIAKDFVQDRDFYEKVAKEKEGIVAWAIIGLRRLIENGWELTESQRSRDYLEGKRLQGNHFPAFMEDVFEFTPEGKTTTKEIMFVYEVWCKQNAYEPRKARTVQTWLADNQDRYGVMSDHHIPAGKKQARGFRGMTIKKGWDYSGKIPLN